MSFATLIAVAPLAAMLVGAVAGVFLGRHAGIRPAAWLLAAVVGLSLVLLVWLASVGQGEEARAFMPFVVLTGGVFPALFGGVVGWLGGRALRRRAEGR